MRISLVNKITVAVVSSIIFFGIISIIFVYIYSKNFLLNNDLSYFEATSLERTQETLFIFKQGQAFVQAIATNNKLLAEYLVSSDKTQEPLILESFNLYNIRNIYSAIYLMDKNGQTLISTDPSFVGQNYSFRDYFQKSIAGTSYVDLAIGVTSGEFGYYFSYPVTDEAKNVLGVLVAKISPYFVDESLKNNFTASSNIMFVDEYGVIVHSNESNRLFHSLGELSEKDKLELQQKRRYEEVAIQPLQYQLVANILNTTEKSTSLEIFDKIDNQAEIINVSRVGNLPFFIITEINKNLYNSQAIKLAFVLVIFIFLTIILAVLLISIILKNYLHLLDDLKVMADKLKSNNFSYRIKSNGHGDLVDIASSFNVAAQALENNKLNTESIITKRTEQLEKINQLMVGRELKMIELKKEVDKFKKTKK